MQRRSSVAKKSRHRKRRQPVKDAAFFKEIVECLVRCAAAHRRAASGAAHGRAGRRRFSRRRSGRVGGRLAERIGAAALARGRGCGRRRCIQRVCALRRGDVRHHGGRRRRRRCCRRGCIHVRHCRCGCRFQRGRRHRRGCGIHCGRRRRGFYCCGCGSCFAVMFFGAGRSRFLGGFFLLRLREGVVAVLVSIGTGAVHDEAGRQAVCGFRGGRCHRRSSSGGCGSLGIINQRRAHALHASAVHLVRRGSRRHAVVGAGRFDALLDCSAFHGRGGLADVGIACGLRMGVKGCGKHEGQRG